MSNKIIIGITAFKHDSSAAIIKNNELIAFSEEERFNRQKNTSELPKHSVAFCLKESNTLPSEVTDIAFYFSKKLSILSYIINNNPLSWIFNLKLLLNKRFFYELFWVVNFFIKANRLKKSLKLNNAKLHFIPHHQSHIFYGIYSSGFDNGVIISNDSVGEYTSVLASSWKNINDKIVINKIFSQKDPNSIGYLYGAITEYLGFNRKNGSGKVMALASFGDGKYYNFFKKNIKLYKNGKFKISKDLILNRNYEPAAQRLSNTFYDKFGKNIVTQQHNSQLEYDIAYSLQKITEEIIINQIKYLKTINKNIVITGGVAQNSVVNGILVNLFKDCNFFVPPIPNDAGCSIGAALYLYYKYNLKLPKYTDTAYLGEKFDSTDIENKLNNFKLNFKNINNLNELVDIIIDGLKNKKIIALFNKEMECGPRALGHRSILALPNQEDIVKFLNEKVKYREWFRPYGVIVPENKLSEYFDVFNKNFTSAPYMSFVFKIKEKYKELLQEIAHIDNTCRVQTIKNDLFFDILFKKLKENNLPEMIINTSLNIKGMPICRTPEDAISVFYTSSIDMIVFNNLLLVKK